MPFVGIGVGIGRQRFAQGGIFAAYAARVAADGGVTEAGSCVNAVSGISLNSSLLLVPSGYKSGVVYSEIPTNGDGDLTFTRASDATRVNSDGLIESPRTNLVLYSEEFDNASWLKTEISITANTITSPDGTLTADTLSIGVDASAVRHRLLQTKTTTIGTTYTGTYYLKANEHRWVQICGVIGYSNGVWANFDLVNGTIGNTGGVDTTASIENVGNGWYRCRVSGVATGTSTTGFEIIVINNTNSGRYPSYQSLVAEDVCYFWGAQLEVGSTATDYIPTTTSVRTTFAGITQDGTSASNIPRLDYSQGSCPALLLEPQRTNSILNSTMDGAVSGSPGTAPTTWAFNGGGGLTRTISLGTENGLNYIDFRFQGTATQTFVTILPTSTGTSASASQNWNFSVYLKLVSGTIPNSRLNILPSTGSAEIELITLTSTLTRFNVTYLNLPSGTTFVRPYFDTNALVIGNAYDFTLRIAAPQLEVGAYATSYIKTTSATVTRLADAVSQKDITSFGIGNSYTLFWDLSLNNADSNTVFWILYNSSSTTAFTIRNFSGALRVYNNTDSSYPLGEILSSNNKYIMRIDENSYSIFYSNSGTPTKSTATITTARDLGYFLFEALSTEWSLNQHMIFPTALTDTQCLELVS